MEKNEVILDILRVANELKASQLSQSQYQKYGKISISTVNNTFGSWNAAVQAAGLEMRPSGPTPELHKQRISDDELLQEIIRLTRELGKRPSIPYINANGHYSDFTYRKRWGTIEKACQVAYEKFGFPENLENAGKEDRKEKFSSLALPKKAIIPETIKSPAAQFRRKFNLANP
jgi:hypothetical protein